MSFPIEELRDLIRLLEARPEWREELRRLLLTEELLALPELVRALAQAQTRTEERLARLEEAVTRLTEAQTRTEERLARLEEAVTRLTEAQTRTEERLEWLTDVVGGMRGDLLELRYREHAAGLFQALLRRIRVVSAETLEALVEEAETRGALSPDEHAEVLRTDLVLTGRRRADAAEVYLVVEVSAVIEGADVERATRRARLLEQATGVPTLAAVAGERILPEAEAAARAAGVFCLLDGVVVAPR